MTLSQALAKGLNASMLAISGQDLSMLNLVLKAYTSTLDCHGLPEPRLPNQVLHAGEPLPISLDPPQLSERPQLCVAPELQSRVLRK